MMHLLLLLSWVWPLLLLPLCAWRGRHWLPVMAALPAFILAVPLPDDLMLPVPWLLAGATLGLQGVDAYFLLGAALVWLASGLYLALQPNAEGRSIRFVLLFLLAMSGNFLLIVGLDLVSFYLGFTLMGLSAYGLVVHDGTASARRAGKVYMVMTLIGEVALFAALVLSFQRTGMMISLPALFSEDQDAWEQYLFLLAFAIKGGVLGLHVWLPLAHPAAPVAASAVLSGAMIKASLVGLTRFLPVGVTALPVLGWLLFCLALAGVLAAICVGLLQRDTKVVLAYSSIAKMGTVLAMLAVVMLAPVTAPLILPLVGYFAVYHGVTKAALFLGVGWAKGRVMGWGSTLLLALPAWILVGAPLGAGADLKQGLKDASQLLIMEFEIPALSTLVALSPWLLLLSSFLMLRFLILVSRYRGSSSQAPVSPLLLLIVVALGLPFWLGSGAVFKVLDLSFILVAAGSAWLMISRPPAWLVARVGAIPPGDLLQLLDSAQILAPKLKSISASGKQWLSNLQTRAGAILYSIVGFFQKLLYRLQSSADAEFAWMLVIVCLLSVMTFPTVFG